MSTTTQLYEMTMFFREGDLGWNEHVHLVADRYSTARLAAKKIMDYRMVLSPSDVEIVYGRVNKAGNPRDSLPVDVPYPLPCTASTITAAVEDEVNTPHDAMYTRFTAIENAGEPGEQAHGVSMYIRGLPDNCVKENEVTLPDGGILSPVIPGSEPPAILVAPATYAIAVGNYLKVLLANTQYAKRVVTVGDSGPVVAYNVLPWTETVFRGYSNRKCGHPFTLRPGRAAAR